METLAALTALTAAALNGVAAAWGAWRWWTVAPSDVFWVLVRSGQAAAVLLVVVAGGLYVAGARPDDGLFWLYAALPTVIGLFAEQFRILSAQTVLEARGLPDARAVAGLPDAEQRSVVLQIIRREMGVMALAAGVSAFLALRAISEVSGL
jgi:hypothetical protein